MVAPPDEAGTFVALRTDGQAWWVEAVTVAGEAVVSRERLSEAGPRSGAENSLRATVTRLYLLPTRPA